MRSHPLLTIPTSFLADVTGGCHKGCQPMQQQQAPEQRHADVTVATGQVGGQMIQQALGGSAAPTA